MIYVPEVVERAFLIGETVKECWDRALKEVFSDQDPARKLAHVLRLDDHHILLIWEEIQVNDDYPLTHDYLPEERWDGCGHEDEAGMACGYPESAHRGK